MWHLIAHFDGRRYDLGALMQRNDGTLLIQWYRSCLDCIGVEFSTMHGYLLNFKSQLDFIKDYKTKHFMNAQLETPDVSARFENE